VVPHYPMRFLAVLAGYPLWKYQLSVIVGRGTRYLGLAGLGFALPIRGGWIALASVVILLLGMRAARRMNQPSPAVEELWSAASSCWWTGSGPM
jgi:hypothetical protein